MERIRLPILRLPKRQILSQQPNKPPDFEDPDSAGPDLETPNFGEDDWELDPNGEAWDPLDLDEEDQEPEPEYGDFWQEPDDFED